MNNVKELLYGKTRCYLIDHVLIDTDWPGTLYSFLRCLKESDVELSDIKYLLITHFHPDHMGIAQELADLGIQIIAFDIQMDHIHFSDKIFEKNRMNFRKIDDTKVLVKPLSESRSVLKRMGVHGEVISTPGHSKDSISIILDEGAAIVGDLPPLRLAHAYGDENINRSWNAILFHHVNTIYYGHDKAEQIGNIGSINEILKVQA